MPSAWLFLNTRKFPFDKKEMKRFDE